MIAEAGVPIVYNATFPLMAATDTPKDNLLKFNRAFHASFRNPDVAAHMEELGYEPMTQMSLDESNAFIKAEIEAWIPILRKGK